MYFETMTGLVNLASHVVKHAAQLPRQPVHHCRAPGRADFSDAVIKKVGVAVFKDDLSKLEARIDRMSQGEDTLNIFPNA